LDDAIVQYKNFMNTKFSRRSFFQLTGTAATGLFLSAEISAQTPEKPLVRFGLVSDLHYADRQPKGTRFFKDSLEKLTEAIDLMNREQVDFVIELGDFKDQDIPPNEESTIKFLNNIEAIFRHFNGAKYHVLGNHDMDSISKKQFLEFIENTGIPPENGYYSFDINQLHFIVLDGNFTKEGKAYERGNFNWEDALVPYQEINWLKNDLKLNKLPVIVFIHQMLDDRLSPQHAVSNAAEIRKVLENSGNVLCVFQGHVHREIYSLINQIHYYSVSGMVDGQFPESNSYSIVEIFSDHTIRVNGFRKANDQEFTAK
jgi:alkaline phosphatase